MLSAMDGKLFDYELWASHRCDKPQTRFLLGKDKDAKQKLPGQPLGLPQ